MITLNNKEIIRFVEKQLNASTVASINAAIYLLQKYRDILISADSIQGAIENN